MSSPNWPVLTAETVRHLQALIRLDTSNLPGNEMLAVDYLAKVLRAEGIEPLTFESAPNRGNLVARLKGTGAKPPLLLYSHTDVVPAESQYWTHPPFAAEIADGMVWGRGAVDMKGTVAQQLMVFLTLKRAGVALQRDVIFAATADEEIGGEDSPGILWLVQNHPDLLRAEFGLTEAGGYNQEFAGQQLYMIQVAEKGTCWIKIKAKGQPGHASRPHPDNAVVHLARAIDRLAAHGLPYHLCEATAGFLDAASAALGGDMGATLQQLKTPEGAAQIFQRESHPELYAMLHNTATPTGLSAGFKTNVIPSTAEAVIDGRTLPGFDPETFLAEVTAVIGEGFDIELTNVSPPLETPHDTPLYQLMVAKLQHHDSTARVVPHMMVGATDAKYLARLGVPSYGFAPVQMPPGLNFNALFHVHDERTPIAGLGWGLQVLYDVVHDYCA